MTVLRVLLQVIAILILLTTLLLLPDIGNGIHGWKGWVQSIAASCVELLLFGWLYRPEGIFASEWIEGDQ